MAYTVINFKTKKALKEHLYMWSILADHDSKKNKIDIRCYNRILGPDLSNFTGMVSLEGPHYPAAHTWYAIAEMKNGIVIKVK